MGWYSSQADVRMYIEHLTVPGTELGPQPCTKTPYGGRHWSSLEGGGEGRQACCADTAMNPIDAKVEQPQEGSMCDLGSAQSKGVQVKCCWVLYSALSPVREGQG